MQGKITRRLVVVLILAGCCKVIGKGVITQLSDPFAERPYWPIDWSNYGRGHVL
jgi:hypothetical protein